MSNAVLAIDLNACRATLLDGQRVVITNWLHAGEFDAGPRAGDSIVAGPCADGQWYSVRIEEDDLSDVRPDWARAFIDGPAN